MNTLNHGKRAFANFTKMSGNSVVIVGAKRTPIGCFMGQSKDMSAPALGAAAARGAIEHAGISPEDVEELFMGNVI
jgi:acetyl-CoA C-acetyltransferase